MALTFTDLDGKYEVHSQLLTGDKYAPNGDGLTDIIDGQTFRKDRQGMIWESRFSILNEKQVEMVSTVDPSHAGPGAFITDEKGNPTKSILTYKTILDVSYAEDGKLVLSGIIHNGAQQARLIMKKVS